MKSKEILLTLKKEAEKNKVSGSYLFYGDKRVDLLFYALEFSKMVMTKGMEDEEEIRRMEKMIESLQHPDIEVINRKNENIKIDEVRKIIYEAIESPYSSPKKIFVFSGVENMRKESSNALLKILEEPPKNVYFILLSRTLNIISTIKSRTIKFHLEGQDSVELEVNRETYHFFDGNEEDIKKYRESGLKLENYGKKVDSIESLLEAIRMRRKLLGEIEMEAQGDIKKEDVKGRAKKNKKNEEKLENKRNIGERQPINVKDEVENIINYNKGIEYIVQKARILSLEEIYTFINDIETEFKGDKEGLFDFLGRITVKSAKHLDGDKLKKLIEVKNSIRNNVNIRSIIFNYFNILQKS